MPPLSVSADHPACGVIADLNALCERWSEISMSEARGTAQIPPELKAGRQGLWCRALVAAGLALELWRGRKGWMYDTGFDRVLFCITQAAGALRRSSQELASDDIDDMCYSLLFASASGARRDWSIYWAISAIDGALKALAEPPAAHTRTLLSLMLERFPSVEPFRFHEYLRIADAAYDEPVRLQPTEPWTIEACQDLSAMCPDRRAAWSRLFRWCVGVEGAVPLRRHGTEMRRLLADIGVENAWAHIIRWVSLIDRTLALNQRHRVLERGHRETPEYEQSRELMLQMGRSEYLHQRVAKGLAWTLRGAPIEQSGEALERAAVACFSTGFLRGTCTALVGSACVAGLSAGTDHRAIAHLARVRDRSRIKPGRAAAERGLAAIAGTLGVTCDELEDIAAPRFGLDAQGTREDACGVGSLVLRVSDDGAVSMVYRDQRRKERRTVPAAARAAAPEVVARMKADAKLIRGFLASSARRLERGMRQERSWIARDWRERLMGHPLLRVAVSGLIWSAREVDGLSERRLLVIGGQGFDRAGAVSPLPEGDARMRVWHPAESAPEEIESWRRLVEVTLTQPFRQAHRELYRPDRSDGTDPRRSKRFADHVVRQGVFSGLCKSREWSMALFVGSSGSSPEWRAGKGQVSARLGVQPIGTATDVNGGFSHLMTGAVVFTDGPPDSGRELRLDEVPLRTFSEIMRDVDLLVSVAGISRDSSALGAAAIGEPFEWTRLASTAPRTVLLQRVDLVGRLVERGAMGPHVEMDRHAILVRGALATYQIDIGSGRVVVRENGKWFEVADSDIAPEFQPPRLPYADDERLTRILRTAMMLAQDIRLQNHEWLRLITHSPDIEER